MVRIIMPYNYWINEAISWENKRKLFQQRNHVVWWVKTWKLFSWTFSKFEIFFSVIILVEYFLLFMLRKCYWNLIKCFFNLTKFCPTICIYCHCTENHIFFFRISWKDGPSKKIVPEYDLSCIIRKDDISFSRKYDLTR